MPVFCFTIGYQGRSLDDLCSMLINYGINHLVDIRERAWSHRPEYRKAALQNGLAVAGIRYTHLKEAGNSFRPRTGQQRGLAVSMREYRKYLRANPSIIEEAQRALVDGTIAFFCYEADNKSCHRAVLVDELANHIPNLKVAHL